jgi:NAD-dependent deacetylase
MQVASPQGWAADPELVLHFYNERRKNALNAKPNEGHKILAELEQEHQVSIITQNIDSLHEQAGSTNVIHLHGELFKVRSTLDDSLIYDLEGWELKLGDTCAKGAQLRPHIVWFGESVPMMDVAIEVAMTADLFLVVGTSMVVYPAASLINFVDREIPKYIIDPNMPAVSNIPNIHCIEKIGSEGLAEFLTIYSSNSL